MPVPEALQTTTQRCVSRLAGIPGVDAVVLGGSWARGRARADSDLDLGLYYRESEPPSLEVVREVACELAGEDVAVTDFYEWGPWVNGGAWLTVDGLAVDLLFRSVERCEHVIDEAAQGRYELHWGQQPPFGFFSPTYLGELHYAEPLAGSTATVERLKGQVLNYPEALRTRVIQDMLWGVEFGLLGFAAKFAARGDPYLLSASVSRFVFQMTLALFALNRRYYVNDKTALEEVGEFELAPSGFGPRVQEILASVGRTEPTLQQTLAATRRLFEEAAKLAGGLYRPRSFR